MLATLEHELKQRGQTGAITCSAHSQRNVGAGAPIGNQNRTTHDDRLLSTALISHADELVTSGIITLGTATSTVIQAQDPFEDMEF